MVTQLSVCALWMMVVGTNANPPEERSIESSRGVAMALQDVYADVAVSVGQSVVCVTAYERVEPEQPSKNAPGDATKNSWESTRRTAPVTFRRLGTASGLVIEPGVILTCRHELLTSGGTLADIIDVETNDMQHFYAHVVGSEPTLNLAILKIEVFGDAPQPTATPIRIGAHEGMKPGHMVLAIADPFGAMRTITPGTCHTFPSQEC